VRPWGFYVSRWGRIVSYGGRASRLAAVLRPVRDGKGEPDAAENRRNQGEKRIVRFWGKRCCYREFLGEVSIIVSYWGKL
jgi:hypothetical protein